MIDLQAILDLHESAVVRWHEREIDNPGEGFSTLVCRQHEQNFRLWHQEDIARSTDVSDAELAAGEAGVAGAAHPVAAATRQVAPTSAVTARETRWQVMRKFL